MRGPWATEFKAIKRKGKKKKKKKKTKGHKIERARTLYGSIAGEAERFC